MSHWIQKLGRTLTFLAAATLVPALCGQDGSARWAYSTLSSSTAGNIVSSPAEGPDGTLYIGIEVGSTTSATPGGRLLALRPDGSQRWSFSTPDWIESTPAIAPDGTVYFGCWDGNLYALRADGTQKWIAPAGAFIASSPALGADGTIYVGTGSNELCAFTPDGTLKWTFPVGDWVDSSPAVGRDGTIYFGSWDTHVYAVRPDGSEKWRFATGDQVVGSPALAADGTVYVGSRDLTLYALNPQGVVKWSAGFDDLLEASPAIGADGTVYIATAGGRLHAFDAAGNERWRYPRADQPALSALYSTPAIRADGTILFGTSNDALIALRSDGTLLWQSALLDWTDSSPLIAADGTVYIGCLDKRLYAINGNGHPLAADSAWPALHRSASRNGRSANIAVTAGTDTSAVAPGGVATLTAIATPTEGSAPTVRWERNGAVIAEAATWTLDDFQPASTGLYVATAENALTTATAFPVIVGLSTTAKVTGDGEQIGPDIQHPNGNIYDQVLLQGQAATIAADDHQITRLSYIDLSDDIVQVEFSGPGTVSVRLATASSPAEAVNYHQPDVNYVRGHASIVVTGATENTHLSVFSVGPVTALNASLFKPDVTYDAVADLAYIAIASPTGQFGGLRVANVGFLASDGITGVYAPGVTFNGPVNVGEITAYDTAVPMLVTGSAPEARITGGSLWQPNNHPVLTSGLTNLQFVDGTTSHNTLLPAQENQAQLEENNLSVTALVVNSPDS